MLSIRPSNAGRAFACLGSTEAESLMPPDTGNKHTERGVKLHSGMALILRIGYHAAITKLKAATWTPEELEAVDQAWSYAETVLDGCADFYVETELDLSALGIFGGERRPDLVMVNTVTRSASVLDWKFGAGAVDDPKVNDQLHIYGAGVLIKFKGQIDSVELVIIQPGAWKEDDRVRSETFSIDTMRAMASTIKQQVALALTPGQQRTPSQKACVFCRAKESCEAFKDMAKVEVMKKTQQREATVVNTGGAPIMVAGEPGDDFGLPLVVVSSDLVTKAQAFLDEALTFKVTDADTAQVAGARAKESRNLLKLIDDQRKAVKERWLKVTQAIDAAPKPATTLLTQGEAHYMKEVQGFLAEEQKKAQAAEAARQKLAREAEQAARAAAEAQAKADRARKPETQAKAQAVAQELQEAAQQAAVQMVTIAPTPAPVLKVTGFQSVEVTVATIPDLSKVPASFIPLVMVVDQKKLDALVKAGALNAVTGQGWLVLETKTEAKRT